MILIGTGSEVSLCVKAQSALAKYGVKARVVSMPSWELFSAQSAAYRESVLPAKIRQRVAIEAGASLGWHRWAGEEGAIIAVDRYGASAPGPEIFQHYGLTAENVAAAALSLLGRTDEAGQELGAPKSAVPA